MTGGGSTKSYRKRGIDGQELLDYIRSQCVITEEGCWLWVGPKNDKGYGKITYLGRKRSVHQITYALAIGTVLPGNELDHTCRRRECCAPDHVEEVTHKENVVRGALYLVSRNRYANTTHCPSKHPYAGDNLYVDKKGHRRCRACNREGKSKTREIAV